MGVEEDLAKMDSLTFGGFPQGESAEESLQRSFSERLSNAASGRHERTARRSLQVLWLDTLRQRRHGPAEIKGVRGQLNQTYIKSSLVVPWASKAVCNASC